MTKFKVGLFLAISCSSFDSIASADQLKKVIKPTQTQQGGTTLEQNKSDTPVKNSNILPAPHLNIPATHSVPAVSSESQILAKAVPLQSENTIAGSEQASSSRKNSKESISTAAAAIVSESQNSPNKPAAYQEFRYSLWTFAGKSNTSYLVERDQDGSFATTLEQEPIRAKTLYNRSINERFTKDLLDEHNQERLEAIIKIGKKYSKNIIKAEKALTTSQSQATCQPKLTLDQDLATGFRTQQEQALLGLLSQQKTELTRLRTERKTAEELAAFIYNKAVETMKDRAGIASYNYAYFKKESKHTSNLISNADKKDPYNTIQTFEALLDSIPAQINNSQELQIGK